MSVECDTCEEIVVTMLDLEVDKLFDSSVSKPEEAHGFMSTCSDCGRTWGLALTTLQYEGNLIPEHAVLEGSDSDYPGLTDLEVREALEGF